MRRRVLPWLSIYFLCLPVCAIEISAAESALMRGDHDRAAEIFEVLSNAGNATAMVRLASLYQRGEGVARNLDKAVALYLSAAEMGHAEAQFNLGNMYLLGEGVPRDEDWALTFYRLAAIQGHGLAAQNMRELYRANGIDVTATETPGTAVSNDLPPEPMAVALVDKLDDRQLLHTPSETDEHQGDVSLETTILKHTTVGPTLFGLGRAATLDGSDGNPVLDGATDDGELPVDVGDEVTINELSEVDPTVLEPDLAVTIDGSDANPILDWAPDDGERPNDTRAAATTAVASEEEPLSSQRELASTEGLQQELDAMLENQMSADPMGAIAGSDAAAIITLNVVDSPVEQITKPISADETEAIRFAQAHGIDVDLAASPAKASAAIGPTRATAVDAVNAQAEFTARIEGAKRALALENFEFSIAKLTRLVDDGYGDAALLLADMADRGQGLPQNEERAMLWRQRAAALGSAEAQYQLADRYILGHGVDPDEAMAITFYREAARGGHPLAKEKLRLIYADAELPVPDFILAREPIAIHSTMAPITRASTSDRAVSSSAPVFDDAPRSAPIGDEAAAANTASPPVASPAMTVIHPPLLAPLLADSTVDLEAARPPNHEVVPGSVLVSVPRPKAQPLLDSGELGLGVAPYLSDLSTAPVKEAPHASGGSTAIIVIHPPSYAQLVSDHVVDMEASRPANHEVIPGSVLVGVALSTAPSLGVPSASVTTMDSPDVSVLVPFVEDVSVGDKLREINIAELIGAEQIVAFDDDKAAPATISIDSFDQQPAAQRSNDATDAAIVVAAASDSPATVPEAGLAASGIVVDESVRLAPVAHSPTGFFGRLKSFFGRDPAAPIATVNHSGKPAEKHGVVMRHADSTIDGPPHDDAADAVLLAVQADPIAREDPEILPAPAATPGSADVGMVAEMEPIPIFAPTIDDAKRALAERRFASAADQFARLANDGNAEAAAHLGYMYYKGEGVDVDLGKSVEWYRRGAAQGSRDAQYNLAVAYAFGEGVTQDESEAIIWYRRAADQGSAIAQYSLGVSYALAEGVLQDNVEAIKWYLAAAEQGYAAAQYNLGYCYRAGQGVEPDDARALEWFAAAARNGHASAQYSVGYMYRSGRGVARDLDQAIRWYRLAAAQGHPDAQADLAYLNTDGSL